MSKLIVDLSDSDAVLREAIRKINLELLGRTDEEDDEDGDWCEEDEEEFDASEVAEDLVKKYRREISEFSNKFHELCNKSYLVETEAKYDFEVSYLGSGLVDIDAYDGEELSYEASSDAEDLGIEMSKFADSLRAEIAMHTDDEDEIEDVLTMIFEEIA